MSISALPPATIRLLGSPLVITTSLSIVKELVENSIDAEATSIEVLVSPDTVESIEVRDNGRGIHPADFDSLGRRGHTSKLRTFNEIKSIGGRTLGFRGEALASANVLAKVTITTRTSGEPVASRLHLLDTGGVAKQERASAPVGTTVRVSELFYQLAVRRQTAVKDASKTIPKIRELLQSYALARLGIKYSFKVLARPKLSWSYNPGKQTTVREAVLRVFGSDLASQCVEVTTPEAASVPGAAISSEPQPTTEYVIKAFLPRPDADPDMVSKRAFVYVDSRPVSTSRGTTKKLISMFRAHLNRISIPSDSSRHLKDPFIRANIYCSPESYDPNIEPSKDDVLFADEQLLLERFETLLLGVYPSPLRRLDANRDEYGLVGRPRKASEDNKNPACERQTKCKTPGTVGPGAAEDCSNVAGACMHLVLGPRLPSVEKSEISVQLAGEHNALGTQNSIGPNNHPPHREQVTHMDQQHRLLPRHIPGLEPRSRDKPANDLNPWVIAKTNSSRHLTGQNLGVPTQPHPPLGTPLQKMVDFEDSGVEHPILRPLGDVPRDLEPLPMQRMPCLRLNAISPPPVGPSNPYRSPISSPSRMTTALVNTAAPNDNRIPRAPPIPPILTTNRDTRLPSRPPRHPITHKSKDKGTDGFMLRSPPSSSGPRGSHSRPYRTYPRPPRLPSDDRVMVQRLLTFDDDRSGKARATHPRTSATAAVSGFPATKQDGGQGVMDKYNTARLLKDTDDSIRSTEGHAVKPTWLNPLQSCSPYPEARAAKDKEPAGTGLPAGDPRGYLMRRQCSLPAGTPRKFRRVNTDMLPLEACSQETPSLTQTLRIDARRLATSLNTAAVYDTYVNQGTLGEGLDMSMGSTEVAHIESRLRGLLSTRTDLGTASHIELNILSGLKGKSRQK